MDDKKSWVKKEMSEEEKQVWVNKLCVEEIIVYKNKGKKNNSDKKLGKKKYE